MTDYIKREDAVEKLEFHISMDLLDDINDIPSADVAPVVRCKDCVSFRYSDMGVDNGITYCASMGIEIQPTDFCSYGERKDNEID